VSDHTTRRRFVVSAGTLTMAALAGCADSGGGDGGATDDGMEDASTDSSMEGNETMDG
jgi:hypothetical protein